MEDYKADYKAMYYHMAGRVAGAVEALEASIGVLQGTLGTLAVLAETLKTAQQKTEEMFISAGDECGEE